MNVKKILIKVKGLISGSLQVAVNQGLHAEEGVTVMKGVNFGSEPYLITLHKNCRITQDVLFITHDGGTWAFRNSMPEYKSVIKYGKIEVEEESFIGARSVIMPGVKIGRNCVIAAGSVVTKNIPDYSVAMGVPAKVFCTTQEYAERCKRKMETQFPNFDEDGYMRNKRVYLEQNM